MDRERIYTGFSSNRGGRTQSAGAVASFRPRSAKNPLITVARKTEKKKQSKKDAQLVLRLNHDLRDRFVDACQDLDTTAAREVRRFIKRFLRKYENGELDE